MSVKIERIKKTTIDDETIVSLKRWVIFMKYVGVSIKTLNHL